MSNITIFNHPMFGQVRVITDDTSKELLFCANDVTDALGYSNGRKAVADHVEKDDVTKRDIIDNLGRMQSAQPLLTRVAFIRLSLAVSRSVQRSSSVG